MKFSVGDIIILNPIDWVTMKRAEDHPWTGKTFRVLLTPTREEYPLYQIEPVEKPNVNNPNAFRFWADEREMTKA
jgi:hypothetical protein